MTSTQPTPSRTANRFAWVDLAKGLCIVAVVCLYAHMELVTVFGQSGWLAPWAAFAKPFRMPDFFLLSGLFLSAVLHRPWRSYLDTKVVHYAYFLVLWATLLYFYAVFVLGDSPESLSGPVKFFKLWIWALALPEYMLWFIQMLPVFFVVTRLLRGASKVLLWSAAALAMVWPGTTGNALVDEFAAYYVFFLTGHFCAPWILRLADLARANRARTAALFVAWCFVNQWAVSAGLTFRPGLDLAFGLLGITAIVALCAWLADVRGFSWLAHTGANSIVVYLAFLIPLTLVTRFAWAGGWPFGIDALATLAVVLGVALPLGLHRATRASLLRYLFERPAWARWPGAEVRAPRAQSANPRTETAPEAQPSPGQTPLPLQTGDLHLR